jgi:hypothetical protein
MSQPPELRSALRVTKYDPALRDERGAFVGDDWTSVSDVGATFNGELLTLQHYLEVEARHLQVIAAFLAEAGVDAACVRVPEVYAGARWWPSEGQRLSRLETVDVVREMLRERGFCRLEAPGAVYIHVGYDYYVYIGGDVPSERSTELARQIGLFVDEQFTSPYHLNPETGEYF